MAVAATPPRQRRGHLLKILGVTFGIAIAVGNVIGSGIMRAPSSIAATVPDTTWIIGLWVLGGLHAALGANVLAELGTAVPQSGGPYLYAHRAFGDVAGLIVGWSIFIAQLAGIAAASIAFSEFLPLLWPAAAGFKLVTAIGMQLVLYGTNIAGLREGRVVQESTSLIKALLLLAFAGAAIAVAGPNGAAGSAVGPAPAFGWMAVIGAYALIKGAYSGWDAPVYFTEENEQPASSVPNALFIGLMITASLYILVNSTLLYALGPVATGATALPFSAVLDRIGGPLPGILFAAGAMITVFGVANANIMSSPRLLFAMARDGLLPPFFGSVNRGGTPDMAMLTVAAGTIALAATGSFVLVFGLIAMLGTVASILVGAAIFVLRRREPDLPRPFRAFGYPVLPALALIIDIALLVLFSSADYVGLAFAAGLSALCVPLAIIARRANAKGRQ